MPLYINGTKVKTVKVDSFAKDYPHFKESSDALLKQEVKTVGPKKLLYICQRELGGTSPTDDVISILGSEDATTCHIAVLRHTGSGATSLIHFDGCCTAEGLQSLVSTVTNLTPDKSSGRLELHLVGGFVDSERNSHEVSTKIFDALCASPQDIHLQTACIIDHNTVYKERDVPFPVIYGLAADVKTGEIYRARFPEKGPDMPLRSARHFTGGKENLEIYDHHKHELVIGPFNYNRLPDVDIFLSLPNHLIRRYLSTSPQQEPEDFEDHVRACLIQLRDFPNPLKTVFKGGKARRYRKDESTGAWTPVS